MHRCIDRPKHSEILNHEQKDVGHGTGVLNCKTLNLYFTETRSERESERVRAEEQSPLQRRGEEHFQLQQGRELTTLEHLRKEHSESESECESLVDIVENSPNPLQKECEEHGDSLVGNVENFSNPLLDSKKLKAMARMAEIGTDGKLPPSTLYLMDIGLDLDQIKRMTRRHPQIIYHSLEKKIKPLVEFFLGIGVPPSDIPKILYKMPQLFGMSISGNIIPTMAYIETFGLDRTQWPRVIRQFPPLLTCSKQKVKIAVDFLYELGLSGDRIGRVLTRRPQIIGYSVEDNLRPTAEYFRSIGVNLTSLVGRFPEVFSLSIECSLKPVTEFFLDKGFCIDEIGIMASRFGCVYTSSLTNNLIPKWDFFLTMDYPRSELVKCPTYFGLSLEKRIKPRYAQMKECGEKLSLGQLLAPSDSDFQKILSKRKMKMKMKMKMKKFLDG